MKKRLEFMIIQTIVLQKRIFHQCLQNSKHLAYQRKIFKQSYHFRLGLSVELVATLVQEIKSSFSAPSSSFTSSTMTGSCGVGNDPRKSRLKFCTLPRLRNKSRSMKMSWLAWIFKCNLLALKYCNIKNVLAPCLLLNYAKACNNIVCINFDSQKLTLKAAG